MGLDEPPAKKTKTTPKAGKETKPKEKMESLLHKIKWRRVVLDEGHVIKNRSTLMSLACAALIAEYVSSFHFDASTDGAVADDGGS